MLRRTLIAVIAGGLALAPAWAESLPERTRLLLQRYWERRDPTDLMSLTQTDEVSAYIFARVMEKQFRHVSLSALRRDLQLGSFSPAGASTSIVARPGASDILSAAFESGAITRAPEGQATTFSLNALPAAQLLGGGSPSGCGTDDDACRKGPGRWIRGLSASVTLSAAGTATPVPDLSGAAADTAALVGFLNHGTRVQALAGRYELFVRERESKSQALLDAAAGELTDKVAAFLTGQTQFETRLEAVLTLSAADPARPGQTLPSWREQTIRALERDFDSFDEIEAALLDRYALAFESAAVDEELDRALPTVLAERQKYIAAQNKVLAEKLYRKALTFDYVHKRPLNQPRTHQLRIVASTPIGRAPAAARVAESMNAGVPAVTMNLNAGISFYESTPAASHPRRVRDAQVSVGFDWTPAAPVSLRPTYSAAYYFQYMLENNVLQFTGQALTPGASAIPLPGAAKELLNTKGPIHVAQFRVSIPIGSTGLTFPAAFSYSTRTELIAGKSFWQGHLGFTYDLSRLKNVMARAANP